MSDQPEVDHYAEARDYLAIADGSVAGYTDADKIHAARIAQIHATLATAIPVDLVVDATQDRFGEQVTVSPAPVDSRASQPVASLAWQVRIIGTDKYLPAATRLDAMRQCQELNAAYLAYYVAAVESNPRAHLFTPFTWAVPDPPDRSTT